jgi:hypothetical protein
MKGYNSKNQWREFAAANSTYPKGGVSCCKGSFVVNETLVFQIKFCGKSPAQMQSPKMLQAILKTDKQTKRNSMGLDMRPMGKPK